MKRAYAGGKLESFSQAEKLVDAFVAIEKYGVVS